MPTGAAAAEAWSAKSGELRVNHADGTYDIARGDKLWRIDEKANRAARGESPYYRAANKSLDLLPLLGLDSSQARDLLLAATAKPATESVGGKRYDVYRYLITDVGRPLMVEARVDQATQLLYSLETLVDRDGKTTPTVTLTVLDANQPVNEDLFVVGDTLTEDGRIGKVSDVQGMVSIKPVMAKPGRPFAAIFSSGRAIGCGPTFAERTRWPPAVGQVADRRRPRHARRTGWTEEGSPL